jgi:hypothetical protein
MVPIHGHPVVPSHHQQCVIVQTLHKSLDNLVHLAKFLGHFRVVRAMLVATMIHTQEVSNQHVPFTTVHGGIEVFQDAIVHCV